jgi:hypothetical protein
VIRIPYAIRLDRQAAAGLSEVSSPQLRDASRIWALVSRASRSGVIAPRSKAALIPGRKPAIASSAFVPVAIAAMPNSSAIGCSVSTSSALQK